MLKNRDIICISSIDWDFIWQGHQEIMSTLARNGNRILFIENTGVRAPSLQDFPRIKKRLFNWFHSVSGIRKTEENLYIYAPLVLPFPYSKIAVKINKILMLSVIKRWMKAVEFNNPIIWSFLPTRIVLEIIDELDPLLFIYYCIDDFASSSRGASKIRKSEKAVLARSDLVFTTSHNLYKRCCKTNRATYLFPFGVNIESYNETRENPTAMPDDMRKIKHPIVGYVGGIHRWVDMALVKKTAQGAKDVSFVLIGPRQVDLNGLELLDNVFILGKKEPDVLPNYVKFFDAGIIPYLKTSYTNNVYPTKTNEYLAMGKPVISTRIPEIVALDRENGGDFIYFMESEKEFASIMDKILSEKDEAVVRKRIIVAQGNSWVVKIEKMSTLIEGKIEEIQSAITRRWAERFKRLYAKVRRRVVKSLAGASILYLVLFQSPFIWFVASPLKIVDVPQKADAIVVFGGGVGETGSPGKSTIERARFSVDLYKEGFADRIIYSSGYTYKYNDAENMRLFALSMGVPEDAIILEKQGNFTFENVKYSSQILRKEGFRKILLVTSPYNTRRSSLVFNHIAKDIEVLYVPVKDSEFYQRGGGVRLAQMRAIFHEYLGILYYLIKGYI